jgi:hypothetical protein
VFPVLQVWQGRVQPREKVILLRLSSIFAPDGSKDANVVYVTVEGGVAGDEKPETVKPITELLNVPVILKVLEVTYEQVARKSLKEVQLKLLTVK